MHHEYATKLRDPVNHWPKGGIIAASCPRTATGQVDANHRAIRYPPIYRL
jgi:hypothetical protein